MAYRSWLQHHEKDVVLAPAARFEKIVLALTSRGSIYAGVPVPGAGYRIRRFRPQAPRPESDAVLEGMMAAVESLGPGAARPAAEQVVSCDGRAFRIVPGCFGRPIVGKSMMVGRVDNRHEVTSPVRWLRALDAGRESFVDLIFDAYRHGDPVWLDYVDQATQRPMTCAALVARKVA